MSLELEKFITEPLSYQDFPRILIHPGGVLENATPFDFEQEMEKCRSYLAATEK